MRRAKSGYTWLLVGVLGLSGCATGAPSGEMSDTIYSTHRMVTDLDRDMSSTVVQLSETTAGLSSRLEASNLETRRLVSLAEENQRRIDVLQRSIDDLTATLYRHFNLTPPTRVESPVGIPTAPRGVDRGDVTVRPPAVDLPGSNVPPPSQSPPTQAVPPAFPPAQQEVGADALYEAGLNQYAAEEYRRALEQFQGYLAQYPSSQNAHNAQYRIALCHFHLGEFDQAVVEFEKLRSRYPTSDKVPQAMYNQAVAHSRIGENARAETLFEQLIRDYPNDVTADRARENLRLLREVD